MSLVWLGVAEGVLGEQVKISASEYILGVGVGSFGGRYKFCSYQACIHPFIQ